MRRPKRFVKRLMGLVITAVSVYLILPSVIATFSSWPELGRLREGSLLIMAGLAPYASRLMAWVETRSVAQLLADAWLYTLAWVLLLAWGLWEILAR